MKVLHVITGLGIGGAEKLLVDFIEESKKRNIDTKVVFFNDGPNRACLEKLAIPIVQIKGLFFKYDPIFLFRLAREIKKYSPDLVHSWLWSSNILTSVICKILKIYHIASIHSVYNQTGKAENSKLRSLLDKIMIFFTSKLIFVSKDMQLQFSSFHNTKYILSKSTVIQNGIKINHALTHKQNQGNNFIIGAVGRFIPLKNHNLLIDGFAEFNKSVPNSNLYLVGYGILEPELRLKVKTLNLESFVHFIKGKGSDYYQFMDCYVLPSDQEGLSISLLEAMSYGLPAIVSNRNDFHDVITNYENGLIIKADKKELFDALKSIYFDPDLRNRLSREGFKAVCEKFNFSLMFDNYFFEYEKSAK